MRMSAAELVAHHRARIGVEGVAVRVVFPDQAAMIAFRDELLLEANEIPRGATRLVRTIDLKEGPEPNRPVLELVDGDSRTHRFFVSRENLIRATAAIPLSHPPIVAEVLGSLPEPDVSPEKEADAERRDDLLELAHLHTRLGRAENAIRQQRRQLNTLRSAFAERFIYPNGRFPSYCCQRCGDQIGWLGRAFQAVGLPLHTCRTVREEA